MVFLSWLILCSLIKDSLAIIYWRILNYRLSFFFNFAIFYWNNYLKVKSQSRVTARVKQLPCTWVYISGSTCQMRYTARNPAHRKLFRNIPGVTPIIFGTERNSQSTRKSPVWQRYLTASHRGLQITVHNARENN